MLLEEDLAAGVHHSDRGISQPRFWQLKKSFYTTWFASGEVQRGLVRVSNLQMHF